MVNAKDLGSIPALDAIFPFCIAEPGRSNHDAIKVTRGMVVEPTLYVIVSIKLSFKRLTNPGDDCKEPRRQVRNSKEDL